MVNQQTAELNRLFAALTDPTRRQMLERLAQGEMTIGELARPFEMSKPAITKHVRTLEAAGLIRRRIEGRVHHCSLHAEPLTAVSKWVNFYEKY
jgi:DNA-binding transcriptional ArsR family regulator